MASYKNSPFSLIIFPAIYIHIYIYQPRFLGIFQPCIDMSGNGTCQLHGIVHGFSNRSKVLARATRFQKTQSLAHGNFLTCALSDIKFTHLRTDTANNQPTPWEITFIFINMRMWAGVVWCGVGWDVNVLSHAHHRMGTDTCAE